MSRLGELNVYESFPAKEQLRKALSIMFDTRSCNLVALNSATKYPSIPTYHEMGERGRLQPTFTTCFDPDETLYVTEKCDGTNARVLFMPDGMFLIGSREDLLYAKGDLIGNPSMGIVDVLKQTAAHMFYQVPLDIDIPAAGVDFIGVVFGEVYGKGVGAGWKNYAQSNITGFRIFDVAAVPLSILERTVEQIASWRDHGGQEYAGERMVDKYCSHANLSRVPSLATIKAKDIPVDIAATHEWLKNVCPDTHLSLDGHKGKPEGVVVRTADRKKIVKIRFEDYERTLRAK